jgi:hypothetical protein
MKDGCQDALPVSGPCRDTDFTKVLVLKLQQHFAIYFVDLELLAVLSHSNVIQPQLHIRH